MLSGMLAKARDGRYSQPSQDRETSGVEKVAVCIKVRSGYHLPRDKHLSSPAMHLYYIKPNPLFISRTFSL
jgi:hypothetical protein